LDSESLRVLQTLFNVNSFIRNKLNNFSQYISPPSIIYASLSEYNFSNLPNKLVSGASLQDQFHICFMVDQVISDQRFYLLSICVASSRFYQEDGQHNQD